MKKYIELLRFEGNDDDLFVKISEDKVFKFRFSEIERLISQRSQIAANLERGEQKEDEKEAESSGGFASYFGFNSIQYYTST